MSPRIFSCSLKGETVLLGLLVLIRTVYALKGEADVLTHPREEFIEVTIYFAMVTMKSSDSFNLFRAIVGSTSVLKLPSCDKIPVMRQGHVTIKVPDPIKSLRMAGP